MKPDERWRLSDEEKERRALSIKKRFSDFMNQKPTSRQGREKQSRKKDFSNEWRRVGIVLLLVICFVILLKRLL